MGSSFLTVSNPCLTDCDAELRQDNMRQTTHFTRVQHYRVGPRTKNSVVSTRVPGYPGTRGSPEMCARVRSRTWTKPCAQSRPCEHIRTMCAQWALRLKGLTDCALWFSQLQS
eukprot:2299792-Rhodomonas_salina.1